jgi:hypothetical protein
MAPNLSNPTIMLKVVTARQHKGSVSYNKDSGSHIFLNLLRGSKHKNALSSDCPGCRAIQFYISLI